MIISLRADQLAARIRADAVGAPKAVFKAMVAGAQRGRAFMVSKSPVDRGLLRVAWKVVKISALDQVNLENDQPYAGVLERGARPFRISSAGIFALKGWVMRAFKSGKLVPEGARTRIIWSRGWDKKLAQAKGQSLIKRTIKKRIPKKDLEVQAERIAYAIAKKWEKQGKQGKFFVRNNVTRLAELMNAEMDRCLSNFFNRPVRGSDGNG